MENKYQGFSNFNHIENVKLQAWNRLATFFTITKDVSLNSARNYLSQLGEVARKQIEELREEIVANGYNKTRRSIIESV